MKFDVEIGRRNEPPTHAYTGVQQVTICAGVVAEIRYQPGGVRVILPVLAQHLVTCVPDGGGAHIYVQNKGAS